MSASQTGLNLLPIPKFHFLIYKEKSRIYTHLTSQIGSKEQMTYYTHEGRKTFNTEHLRAVITVRMVVLSDPNGITSFAMEGTDYLGVVYQGSITPIKGWSPWGPPAWDSLSQDRSQFKPVFMAIPPKLLKILTINAPQNGYPVKKTRGNRWAKLK